MPKEQLQDPSEELEQFEDAPEEIEEDPQPPKLVRIRLNGQTLEVTEEQAAVIEAHEAQRKSVIDRMGTELGTLRQQARQQQQPARDPGDDDIEWLSSPSKREARLREELRNELREEMHQQTLIRNWWDRFYTKYPDLRDHSEAVEYIGHRDRQELGLLDQEACHRELAARVRRLTGQPTGRPLPNRQVQSERASNGSPAPRPRGREGDTPQQSYGVFGEALRQMQEKRRKARSQLPKE